MMKRAIMTVDCGATHVRTMLYDLCDRDPRAVDKFKLDWDTAPSSTFKQLADQVRRWESEFQVEIVGIVVGLAALHDQNGVIITWPNRPDWNGIPFKQELGRMVNRPIVLFDDAHLAALGEYYFGLNQSVDNLLYITIGTGIGGALIVEGKLFKGSRGASGQLGHMTVHSSGDLCSCGGRGCLQLYASGRGIERWARDQGLSINHASDVFQLAEEGNVIAQHLLDDSLKMLSIGIANAVRIFDPMLVVIGGGMVNRFPNYYSSLEQSVQSLIGTLPQKSVTLNLSTLSDQSALWGGVAYGIKIFQ